MTDSVGKTDSHGNFWFNPPVDPQNLSPEELRAKFNGFTCLAVHDRTGKVLLAGSKPQTLISSLSSRGLVAEYFHLETRKPELA